jgi:hypothetical protein
MRAASSVLEDRASLPKILDRCISTVFSATDSRRAIARLVRQFPTSVATCNSRLVRADSRPTP